MVIIKSLMISIILIFLSLPLYAQYLTDSTFVLDGQLNCISPTDTNHNNFSNTVVGTPVNSNLLLPNGIYRITVSGEVTINNLGDKMPGVLIMYIDATEGNDEEYWRTITTEDTIDFIVAQNRERFFHAVLFDAENVDDNSGQFFLNLELIGWVWIERNNEHLNNSFELSQNYPNPFNPITSIKYTLHKKAHVRVEIYNAIGQKIETLIDKEQFPDIYLIKWDVSNNQLSSGVYFYQVTVNNEVHSRRMIYLK